MLLHVIECHLVPTIFRSLQVIGHRRGFVRVIVVNPLQITLIESLCFKESTNISLNLFVGSISLFTHLEFAAKMIVIVVNHDVGNERKNDSVPRKKETTTDSSLSEVR